MNNKILLHDKTAIVTGANGAIGKAIARQLAAMQAQVIMVCRNKPKGEKACSEIIKQTGNKNIFLELVDLSLGNSIRKFSDRYKKSGNSLHILINNASITPRDRQENDEGLEMQFAVNIMGYFRMMKCFSEILARNVPARIVNVSSYWAGNLNLNDLQFKKRQYNNNTAYMQSKLAERLLTYAFAKRLKLSGITVNACHPGDVNSQLSNSLGFGGHETPDEGADTPVFLAVSEPGGQKSGCYYEHRREAHCSFSSDLDISERLYEICEEIDEGV